MIAKKNPYIFLVSFNQKFIFDGLEGTEEFKILRKMSSDLRKKNSPDFWLAKVDSSA